MFTLNDYMKTIINGLLKKINGLGGNVIPDYSQNDSSAADFIKNRPGAYKETNPPFIDLTWDGNAAGHYTVSNGEVTFVKVSDKFLTSADDAFGSTIKIMAGGVEQTLDVPDEYIQIEDNAIVVYEGIISINDAPHVLKGIGTIEYNGIYFMTTSDAYASGFKTREITTVHKIPFEYVNYRLDVKLTVDTSSMEIVSNRSVSEIVDAFNAGYAIYAIARINEMSAVYNLCRVQNDEVVFSQCYTKVIDDYEYNITETMTLNSESNNVTYKQVAVKPSFE